MNLDILKIASDTKNHKKLDDCTHKSKHKNPLCGDEMEVGVKIKKNKILDFAYQCKSCIYCQASASVLSKFSINKTVNSIKEVVQYSQVYMFYFSLENSASITSSAAVLESELVFSSDPAEGCGDP